VPASVPSAEFSVKAKYLLWWRSQRTGFFHSVLEFVLVSSRNLGLLKYAENLLKSEINPIKSMVLRV
jgi:hypothetical protein